MSLVPLAVAAVVTVVVMGFYSQFVQVYVFFRQRCLTRAIPQNYVVMIHNIPSVIDTLTELRCVLEPIEDGVRAIVPVPRRSDELTQHFAQL